MRDVKELLRKLDVESKAVLNHLRQLKRCSGEMGVLLGELAKVQESEVTAAQVAQLKAASEILGRVHAVLGALD